MRKLRFGRPAGAHVWPASAILAAVLPHEGMLPNRLLSSVITLRIFNTRRLWACSGCLGRLEARDRGWRAVLGAAWWAAVLHRQSRSRARSTEKRGLSNALSRWSTRTFCR